FGAGASGSTARVYTRENEETSLAWMTVARAIAVTIDELILRTIRENDWAAILDLANLSLSELPSAQRQDEWLETRLLFLSLGGFREAVVATERARVVGWAAVERRGGAGEDLYRLFVVVGPPDRASLGTVLFGKLRDRLLELNARRAWMLELAGDRG